MHQKCGALFIVDNIRHVHWKVIGWGAFNLLPSMFSIKASSVVWVPQAFDEVSQCFDPSQMWCYWLFTTAHFSWTFNLKTYACGMNNWWKVHPYKCLSSFEHRYFLPRQNAMPLLCPNFLQYVFTFCQQYLQAIRRMSDNVYVGTNLICTLWEICCPFVELKCL